MTIKMVKIVDGQWNVLVGNSIIGQCMVSNDYGGSYKVQLVNGTTIWRFTKKDIREAIKAEYLKTTQSV